MTIPETPAHGTTPAPITTPKLIATMLRSGQGISDLVFSPLRPPQVEQQGQLVAVDVPERPMIRPEDTARIAGDLIAGHSQALATRHDQGASDFAFSLPEVGRFRVNVFRQRSTFAIVMRVIAPLAASSA